mgnify:CR=1 FL=1
MKITKDIRDEILRLREEGYLHREIAQQLGCGISTVTHELIKMGIRTSVVDKNAVKELHDYGYTDLEIALMLGCTRSNITIILNRMGITDRKSKINNVELRNRISNSLLGRYIGSKNPNYRGALNEKSLARGMLKTISKRIIRNRGTVCVHCKSTENIETHHIKPFKVILDEFLKTTYDHDKTTFYAQLITYPDFIDESNIVVLCHKCHFNTHYSDNHELSPYRWKSATTIESAYLDDDI